MNRTIVESWITGSFFKHTVPVEKRANLFCRSTRVSFYFSSLTARKHYLMFMEVFHMVFLLSLQTMRIVMSENVTNVNLLICFHPTNPTKATLGDKMFFIQLCASCLHNKSIDGHWSFSQF